MNEKIAAKAKVLQTLENASQKLTEIEDFAKEGTQAGIDAVLEHIGKAKGILGDTGNPENEMKTAAKAAADAGRFAMGYEWMPGISGALLHISADLYRLVGDEKEAKAADELAESTIAYAKALAQVERPKEW